MGFRSRLFVLVVVATLPLFGLVVVQAGTDRDRTRANAIDQVQRLASLAGAAEERVLSRARDIVVALSVLPEVRSLSPERCTPILASLLPKYADLINLAVTDPTGLVVCSAVPSSGQVSLGDRPYLRRAVETRSFAVGEYQVGRITGQHSVSVALPILGPAGAVEGVVVAGLQLDALGDIAAAVGLPAGASFTLVDRDGTILARNPDRQAWIGRSAPEAPLVQVLLSGGEGTIETAGVDGVTRLYAYLPVGADIGAGFHLAVGFDAATLSAEADRSLVTSLAWLVLVLAIVLVIVLLGSQTLILRPVETVLAATRRLAAGDLGTRTGLAGSGGEFGRLANAFDEMAASVERRVDARTDELHQALEALAHGEERLRTYLSSSINGVLVLEPIRNNAGAVVDFRIAYLNEEGARTLGRSASDLVGQRLFELPSDLGGTDQRDGWLRVLETGDPLDLDGVEFRPLDGRDPRIYDYRVAKIDGDLALYLRDVTQRVLAARELERLLAEVEDLYDNAPVGYHSLDADGIITRINNTELAWLGYAREELVGRKRIVDVMTSSSVSAFQESFPRFKERGWVRDLEFDFVRRDGSLLPVVISATAMYDEAGRYVSSRSTVDDITERRRAQEALRRSEAELDRFFSLSSDMFGVFNLDDTFRRVNAAWESILGYSPDDLVGRPFIDLVHPDDRERTTDEFRRATAEGTPTTQFENRYRHKDGSYRWLDWAGRLVPGEGVQYAVARDITKRHEIEAALESAHREAEAANLAKSQFLSRMSHELRTPLNAILGFAQLLGMDHLDDDQRESQEQILRAGRHLLNLVNEVLDLSRIETGQLPISPEPVNMCEAIEDAVALMGPLATSGGITLLVEEIAPDQHVLADRQRLRQVLLNLLSNAVKYNRPYGTIRIACQPAGTGALRLAVTDEGAGINPAQMARLFAPFDRLGAEADAIEGTGLGLSLSKALVEHMDGAIGVDSTPGEGSTFWIELPVTTPPAVRRSGAPPPSAVTADATPSDRHGTVLCIEDNLSNVRLIERAVALRANVRLLSAMLGGLGLDLAREHRPDLVLLDLHLPDMSGEELLARLRADPATRDIPVVVLSADATPGHVERLLADGARAYLTKPLDLGEFLALVDEVLGQDPSG